jgi:hypothetical protein
MVNSEEVESVSKAIIARLADEDILDFDSGFPECNPSEEVKTFCNPVNRRCYLCCRGAFGPGWHALINSAGESVECSSSETIAVTTLEGRVIVSACSIVRIE